MLQLQDLTVGHVSGMIAAAVFTVQFLVPVILPIVLLGSLRLRSTTITQTAVSWCVVGRFLHSSLWPVFLRTDSAATFEACKRALFISLFNTFMLVLTAITAVVTPLGLYEGIAAEIASSDITFHYIRDPTPMGYGTPPRMNTTFNRICGWPWMIPCPNDNNKATVFENETQLQVTFENDWYDSRIPQKVIDVFQSGAISLGPTVSSSFDIQYRNYFKSIIDDVSRGGPKIDNGTARTVGTYQQLSSFVLSDAILAVEGLVVDMKNGGIGFRNHTAPMLRQLGSTWTEDLLFVVPDTVCVNTNITLDFQIAGTHTENLVNMNDAMFKPEIVDHGGFVQINKTNPDSLYGDMQANPDLWHRAYTAAWYQNALAMAHMNVTNPNNDTLKLQRFSYLNSTMGKSFPLYFPGNKNAGYQEVKPNSLFLTTFWGGFLQGTDMISFNYTSSSNYTSIPPIYSNPFNIGPGNWSAIGTVCQGSGGGDLANFTNIASKCGLLYGAAHRKDGSNSSLFEPGSAWEFPLYSCASATKATIKTVAFRFNGTSDDLSGLRVISVVDKVYTNDESMPLWGVENTSMELRHGGPLWGIVSKDREKELNLTTARKESLYLPGFTNSLTSQIESENNPGAEFAALALDMTYTMGTSTSPVDYTGKANLAMYKKWQELSKTSETSSRILNLIWTDIAANMVVGTKSLQPHGISMRIRDDTAVEKTKIPPVITYTRRIKYNYVYGIPAFLTLVLFTLTTLSSILLALFSGAKPSTMRTFLQHTSAGRFLTSQSQASQSSQSSYGGHSPSLHDDGYSDSSTKIWVKGVGKELFTLGADGWIKNAQLVSGHEGKEGGSVAYVRVPGEDERM